MFITTSIVDANTVNVTFNNPSMKPSVPPNPPNQPLSAVITGSNNNVNPVHIFITADVSMLNAGIKNVCANAAIPLNAENITSKIPLDARRYLNSFPSAALC